MKFNLVFYEGSRKVNITAQTPAEQVVLEALSESNDISLSASRPNNPYGAQKGVDSISITLKDITEGVHETVIFWLCGRCKRLKLPIRREKLCRVCDHNTNILGQFKIDYDLDKR